MASPDLLERTAALRRGRLRPGSRSGQAGMRLTLNPLKVWREVHVVAARGAGAPRRGRLLRLATRIAAHIQGVPDLAALIDNGMRVGYGTAVEYGVLLDPAFCWLIEIGEACTFAPYATVLAHDAGTQRALGYTRLGRVRIGNRVFVGAHALILPGLTIGDDAVVGAGSVVTRDVAAGTVVAGAPARELGSVAAYAERHRAGLAQRPTWSREWTRAGGITAEQREQMRAALADGEGYVR